MNESELEIQRADPQTRRRAVRLAMVGLVLGGALLMLTQPVLPRVEGWVMADQGKMAFRAVVLLVVSSLALGIPPLAFAWFVWRQGRRVVSDGRFPPRGMAVAKDTVVLRGNAALKRGRLLQFLAVLLVAAVGLLAGTLWKLGALIA